MNTLKHMIGKKALFVVSHSGGKDSQAMMIKLLRVVPRDQIVVIHSCLGHVEWKGAQELAEKQAKDAGVPFVVARAAKTFFEMVDHRHKTRPDVPCWPSPKHRQCTSDLKRGPIRREARRYARANGFDVIVNCMGLRAEESTARSKRKPFRRMDSECNSRFEWFEWLPIHADSTDEVFETIYGARQEPHWAYAKNKRLSCVFCIMADENDIRHGAQMRPELAAEYIQKEEETGYTMHASGKSLLEIIGGLA